ncbi:MAG: MFS transporter [Cruoricaptor ignavus]|nr:MFS transporter [Cruoricaptor ignavus]
MKTTTTNRWLIALSATVTHLLLGTVYAWSFFQKNISETYHWSQSETAWAFSISIFMLGITAAYFGGKIERYGVKKLAVLGTILYALGFIISFFALKFHLLYLLYLGFGIVGGIGLGLAYVTPVAAVSGWFPDKQGLVTGMVVMGFGLGALVMSKIFAPFFLGLFNGNLANTFLSFGILLLIIHPFCASFLKPKPTEFSIKNDNETIHLKQYILKTDYILLWFVFTFNIIAGMIFIAFQSPLLQDLLKHQGETDTFSLEQKGATLIGVSALFNGIGRFFWGSLSDKMNRITTFRLLLLIEISMFIILILTQNPTLFFIGVCVILLCYGGGFGIIPALIKERYGQKLMASIYGITLIGWGVGGIIGPQITAYMKDHFPENAGEYSFYIGLMLLGLGFIFSLFIKKLKN